MPAIEGLPEFLGKLNKLDLAVQRKGLQAAVKQGAELIRAAASRNVVSQGLVLTGRLSEREIISIEQAVSNAYVVVARIGPARNAFYGLFGEYGTIYETEKPFLIPAFEEQKAAALTAASAVLKSTVESAVL